MAARRRSSAGRSASRTAAGSERSSSRRLSGRGAARPPAGRARKRPARAAATSRTTPDGKYPVCCPRCGVKYHVPEDYLDTVVHCKHCHAAFTPRHALGSARRPQKGAGAAGGLLRTAFILSPFVLFLIIYNLAVKDEPAKTKVEVTKNYLTQNDEAFRVFADFLAAVEHRNTQVIDVNLAWERFWNERNRGKKSDTWTLLGNERQQAFKAALANELFEQTPEETPEERYYRRKREQKTGAKPKPPAPPKLADLFKAHSAEHLVFESAVELEDDTKELRYPVKLMNKERITLASATVESHVVKAGGVWKVAGWRILDLPIFRKKRKKMRHKYIKPPKWVEVEVKGKKIKQYQTDIVPLPHLDDTPPALRQEIDRLIDIVYAETDDPKAGIKASQRLIDIGKPAVPRILNSFYERQGKTRAEREGMNILVKAYNNITLGNIAFLPDKDPNSTFGGTDKDREVLLKTAYAHWYFNYWKKDFQGDSDEELDKAMEEGSKPRPGKKGR